MWEAERWRPHPTYVMVDAEKVPSKDSNKVAQNIMPHSDRGSFLTTKSFISWKIASITQKAAQLPLPHRYHKLQQFHLSTGPHWEGISVATLKPLVISQWNRIPNTWPSGWRLGLLWLLSWPRYHTTCSCIWAFTVSASPFQNSVLPFSLQDTTKIGHAPKLSAYLSCSAEMWLCHAL